MTLLNLDRLLQGCEFPVWFERLGACLRTSGHHASLVASRVRLRYHRFAFSIKRQTGFFNVSVIMFSVLGAVTTVLFILWFMLQYNTRNFRGEFDPI